MSFLRIERLTKVYGKTAVLQDIDLEVAQGEFIVLVGPSGCGKSTLLRTIAGLEEATSGALHLAGVRVNDIPPRERDVAMVFQNYALYPHLTVRENLGFALRMRGVGGAEIDDRARETARMLELEPLLDRLPKQLSGGQRQRVAMGRAIMRKPKLFLFDEPLSNLDAKLRVLMRTEIAQLHRQLGATSVFVTHDQVEAMTMADRIVLLHEGRIQQVGTPRELYHAPSNRYVASFIGSPAMNFVEAEAVAADSVRLVDGQALTLSRALARHPGEGAALTLGLRPEALRLCEPEHGLWCVEVVAVEDLGYQAFVYAQGAQRQILCALASAKDVPRVGQTVGIAADLSQAHWFDAAGLALERPL